MKRQQNVKLTAYSPPNCDNILSALESVDFIRGKIVHIMLFHITSLDVMTIVPWEQGRCFRFCQGGGRTVATPPLPRPSSDFVYISIVSIFIFLCTFMHISLHKHVMILVLLYIDWNLQFFLSDLIFYCEKFIPLILQTLCSYSILKLFLTAYRFDGSLWKNDRCLSKTPAKATVQVCPHQPAKLPVFVPLSFVDSEFFKWVFWCK